MIIDQLFTITENISSRDLADILAQHLERHHPGVFQRYNIENIAKAVMQTADDHAGAAKLDSSNISIMLRQVLEKLATRLQDQEITEELSSGDYLGYTIEVDKYSNPAKGVSYWYAKTQIGDKTLAIKGKTGADARENLKAEIDKFLATHSAQSKQTSITNIDFNAAFVRNILNGSNDRFYAKIVKSQTDRPQLIIAGEEMSSFGNELRDLGFRPSQIRIQAPGQNSTPFPSLSYTANQFQELDLIPNGRYELYNGHRDRDGNRVFDLRFVGRSAIGSERVTLKEPAFIVAVSRPNVKEAEFALVDLEFPGHWNTHKTHDIDEDNPGLYANIHAKRRRIAAGSGERMRKPGSKGAPTAQSWRDAAKTAKKESRK